MKKKKESEISIVFLEFITKLRDKHNRKGRIWLNFRCNSWIYFFKKSIELITYQVGVGYTILALFPRTFFPSNALIAPSKEVLMNEYTN